MMRFEYVQAKSVEEAVSYLGRIKGARVIAGGTDLVVQMKRGGTRPECVVDINSISDLEYIACKPGEGLRIGALTKIEAIKQASIRPKYRCVQQAASQMASVGIRNLATIGGNLCNASPSADMAPGLIVLGAKAKIVGSGGMREIGLEEFFTGPGATALGPDELLVEIAVPEPPSHSGGVYLKHSTMGSTDLAVVGVAALVITDHGSGLCTDIKLALGAVAPTPIRAYQAEKVIRGRTIDRASCQEAARSASEEARPISDVRASAWYRKEMVAYLCARAIDAALGRAKEGTDQ